MRPEVSKQLSEILFDSLEVKDAIAYALYYGVNPDSKMCIPNCAYERAEKLFKEWRDSYREKSNEGQSIRVKNLESLNNKLEETNYNLNCNLNTITDLLEKAKEIIVNLRNIISSDITCIDTEEKGLFYKQAVDFLKEIGK